MPVSIPPSRYLSMREAAEYLACSQRTLHRRIADGSLPAHRAGPKLLRFAVADLEAFARPVPTVGADPLAEHIAAVVAAAPELSAEQADRLAGLLRAPAGDSR